MKRREEISGISSNICSHQRDAINLLETLELLGEVGHLVAMGIPGLGFTAHILQLVIHKRVNTAAETLTQDRAFEKFTTIFSP